jgi:hypothetical protein
MRPHLVRMVWSVGSVGIGWPRCGDVVLSLLDEWLTAVSTIYGGMDTEADGLGA